MTTMSRLLPISLLLAIGCDDPDVVIPTEVFPPDPCDIDLPVNYLETMPYWSQPIIHHIADVPWQASGEVETWDGQVGEMSMHLAWSPGEDDRVDWGRSHEVIGSCAPSLVTDITVIDLTVDGATLSARGPTRLLVMPDRAENTYAIFQGEFTSDHLLGTIFEPPSGRPSAHFVVALFWDALASPPAWHVEVAIDEHTTWSSPAYWFPMAEGLLYPHP